jgi:hypothetical protein
MDRKSLLLQEDLKRPVMPQDPKKLEVEADEGLALRMMSDTRGWKLLLEKFIKPRSSVNRILQAKTALDRNEACGAVEELTELMNFVDRHIKDGQTAYEQREAMKKGGSK